MLKIINGKQYLLYKYILNVKYKYHILLCKIYQIIVIKYFKRKFLKKKLINKKVFLSSRLSTEKH